MSNEAARYEARGVSASKSEVHAAIAGLSKGVFPDAFCHIVPDLRGDPQWCTVIHSDGSGTKSALAYLKWRETGDAGVFRGVAQDSIVMNVDDLLCVGVTGRMVISGTINRNARACGAEVIAALIQGSDEFIARLNSLGVEVVSGGGETADVGDLVRTIVVDSAAAAAIRRSEVIAGGIVPGLVIVGLSSTGRASYETAENSGIGSNGLTSARHDLLAPYYRERYPETVDPGTDPKLAYCGPFRLEDTLPGSTQSVGEALLSPTRTYAPVVARLLSENRPAVRGLVHCTGGGLGKCRRFGRGVRFVKDDLFALPPIFGAIQEASGSGLLEMARVYNLGQRLEVYCAAGDAAWVIATARTFGIEAKIIGRTVPTRRADGQCEVTVSAGGETVEL